MANKTNRMRGVKKFSDKLSNYQDIHKGQSIIVCGCGVSLNTLPQPPNCITIGVNDVGRLFDPDYLVVLNARHQFKGDRFKYVENSHTKAIFTQLDLSLRHPRVIKFKLGQRGGVKWDTNSLPYTQNSPYVAVCLAAYMGAARIGLIGVDFTEHHFFAKTGKHPLTNTLAKIDSAYGCLASSLQSQGIELANLSRTSRLKNLNKVSLQQFQATDSMDDKSIISSDGKNSSGTTKLRSSTMKIQIEKHQGRTIGGFFDCLATTARELGYRVQRGRSSQNRGTDIVSIVWNGRHYRNNPQMIYCEHGWLPREAYQVSHKGINADSHIAQFEWNNKWLSKSESQEVSNYIQSLRRQTSFSDEYMQTTAPAAKGLPPEFLLFPLQLEKDTNIVRHVSSKFRRMQHVIDYISCSDPPYPVIYKQHPADKRRGNQHLQLKVQRKNDQIRNHDLGNIHQILKSGCCKGIISLNSNVVHDGFLWEVPAIVLGRNIWPKSGISPFLNKLPEDWQILDQFYSDENTVACREAYIHYLMTHQWTFSDAKDQDKVGELLERKIQGINGQIKLVSLASRERVKKIERQITVNVVATNRGWLFEDLKSHFEKLHLAGIKVVSSNRPIKNSDAWIYLRAHEANQSPDKSRTLVQIHDQFELGFYRQGGNRRVIKDCGAICLTNPAQQPIIESSGISLTDIKLLVKPLGPLNSFGLRKKLPNKFTVAWIGRPVDYQGEDLKRVEWLTTSLDLTTIKNQVSVVLIGDRLDRTNRKLLDAGLDSHYFPRSKFGYHKYPTYYQNIDCVAISSKFAAGPNCLFESLASGVPVVATRCGWVDKLVQNGLNGFIVNSIQEMADAFENIYQHREEWFSRREAIRESLGDLSLESWMQANVQCAASLKFKQHFENDITATG